MSDVYDNRDFYRPIVTPYDVEIALNPAASTDVPFSYNYNTFLSSAEEITETDFESGKSDVSLITGKMRTSETKCEERRDTEEESGVSLRSEGALLSRSDCGAGFLSARTWKGLEQNLGAGDVQLAQEGLTGIATNYKSEPS